MPVRRAACAEGIGSHVQTRTHQVANTIPPPRVHAAGRWLGLSGRGRPSTVRSSKTRHAWRPAACVMISISAAPTWSASGPRFERRASKFDNRPTAQSRAGAPWPKKLGRVAFIIDGQPGNRPRRQGYLCRISSGFHVFLRSIVFCLHVAALTPLMCKS